MPHRMVIRAKVFRAPIFSNKVARDFEEHIAQVDDAGAEPVHRLAEAQILNHLQLGEADVVPVQPRHYEETRQERDNPLGDLRVDCIEVSSSALAERRF